TAAIMTGCRGGKWEFDTGFLWDRVAAIYLERRFSGLRLITVWPRLICLGISVSLPVFGRVYVAELVSDGHLDYFHPQRRQAFQYLCDAGFQGFPDLRFGSSVIHRAQRL